MEKAISKQGKPQLRGKRWLIGIVTALSMIGIAGAIWLSIVSSSGTFTIDSDGTPLTLSADFQDLNMDASAGNVTDTITFSVDNNDGQIPVNIITNVTRTDFADGCDDYIDDVAIVMFLDGTPMSEDFDGVMAPGVNNIMATATATHWSCPQNVTVTSVVTSTA